MDEYATQPEARDYATTRKRMGGPIGPPRYVRQRLENWGRQTGKTLRKKNGRKYSKPLVGYYGNTVSGIRAREKRVNFWRGSEPPTALKTWSFNSASYWQSNIGKQRCIFFPVLDATMYGGLGSSDNQVDANSEQMYIKSIRHGVEVVNTCNNALFMKAYFLDCKTDSPSDPVAVYGTALSDAGRSTDTGLATYIEPTMLPRFNRTFAVHKIKDCSISAGGTAKFSRLDLKPKAVSLSSYPTGIGAAKGVTSYIMLVWHGSVARCTTTTPATDGASIGPSEITVLQYGDVNYKVATNNQRLVYDLGRTVQVTTASNAQILPEDTDAPTAYAQV